MSHFCTQRTEGYCDTCSAAADRAAEYRAERDVEREDWPDAELWNYEPNYGKAMTRGGW